MADCEPAYLPKAILEGNYFYYLLINLYGSNADYFVEHFLTLYELLSLHLAL
jgi:hypothetical protein